MRLRERANDVRLGCVAICLVSALLTAACGNEAAPWTGFSPFDLDAGSFDFPTSWRPPATGARRAGTDNAGAGAPAAPEIGTGAPEDRDASVNSAGAAGAAGSAAGDSMRGDASDAADGGMGGSAGARTDDGRRRGPFADWWERGGAADRADAGDDGAEPQPDVDAGPALADEGDADADDAGVL